MLNRKLIAWEGRAEAELGGVRMNFIGWHAFIKNKKSTGRPQDQADLEALGENV